MIDPRRAVCYTVWHIAKALTEKMGFEESKYPLCVKIYDSLYTDLVPAEKEG